MTDDISTENELMNNTDPTLNVDTDIEHSNNEKLMNTKTILRLFPYLNDKNKAKKLRIDEDSVHYISLREHAEQISLIIKKHLGDIGMNLSSIIITDATAGVGGNTISFGMHFKHVYAIEIDKLRASYLKNNIDVYDLKNVTVINDDCLNILHKLEHNVVFIDPPWGGKSYKEYDNLKLNLSDISVEAVCNHISNDKVVKKCPELIILKLPTNYDIKYLYKVLVCKTIYFYDLKKMFILVIVNANK